MQAITTSVFELFKKGPGPSSSHTIGPMEAGWDFLQAMRALPASAKAKAEGLEVRLFGSLSATGKGHGTVKAILAGLLGNRAEDCPTDLMEGLSLDSGTSLAVDLDGASLPLRRTDVVFDSVAHSHRHSNTLLFRLLGGGTILLEHEYYSIGGGFIQRKGRAEPERGLPAHPYGDMAELKERLASSGLSLDQLMLANETALTGASESQVRAGLADVLHTMLGAVERGLDGYGTLPGLGLHRKALQIHARARGLAEPERSLAALAAYGFAASEENASRRCVVTAPTSGASGVIPAVCAFLIRNRDTEEASVRRGLLAAAVVGFLAKHNASISGAEVGCQGEVGVASAMGAALLAHVHGHPVKVVENAAEIALEHHLGLTCDPIGGFVQVPCIERNAMGAVKAFTAYTIAASMDPSHQLVGLDQVIRVMLETGRDMNTKYKETSEGGLAVSRVVC